MTAICCQFPVLRYVYFVGMVFFTTHEYSLNFVPLPHWTGTARGYAFTAVSLFAVPLLGSMIFSFKYKVRFFPPGSFFYFLYFLSILLSGVNAVHMHQWGFEVYKMFWMYITFLAAFNFLNNSKDLTFFVYVVCGILILLFLIGLKQKYLEGRYQIRSTFPHQNSLSLYLELFGILTLGVLMNEKMNKLLFSVTLFAFVGSTLLILFTYSRGGLVVFFGGIAIVCAASIVVNGFSVRRLTLMLVGLIVMLGVVGYALPRIIQRFTKAPESSKQTRIFLALAARRMANDYRLGVGANNFSEYSGRNWSYAEEQFRYYTPGQQYGAVVETIYLLVAAECGWWGLCALGMWFLYYYFSAIISMIVLRKKPCCGIVIGVFGGLTCVYWHSTLEWSLKQFNNFAEQMIVYALIAVIATHRKDIKAAYQRSLIRQALSDQKKRMAKAALKHSQPPSTIHAPAPVAVPPLASVQVLNPAPVNGVMEDNMTLEAEKPEESPQ